MQAINFLVENVKCGGCATNIHEGLMNISGVSKVSVDVASGQVEVHCADVDREILVAKLVELGYPLAGN